MLKRLLFETRFGAWLLARFEMWAGLAVVDAAELGSRRVRIIGEVPGGE
jgi:hypothetical protein